MHEASIRRASAPDLPGVEMLLISNRLPTDGVAQNIDDFFVADRGGLIVGAIGMEMCGRYALLRSAAVADDMKGKGLGRTLVERLLEDARARSVESLFLLTTTAEKYFPAFGFQIVQRASVPKSLLSSPEFQGACPASAVVMRADLADDARPDAHPIERRT